jgi:hypothetical protein
VSGDGEEGGDGEGEDGDAAEPAVRPALPDLAPQTHQPERSPAGPVDAEQ